MYYCQSPSGNQTVVCQGTQMYTLSFTKIFSVACVVRVFSAGKLQERVDIGITVTPQHCLTEKFIVHLVVFFCESKVLLTLPVSPLESH